jgi:hypothetical protein
VVLELVVTPAQVGDAQDDQLGVATRQPAARHQAAGEAQPAAEELVRPPHRQEQVRRLGAGDSSRQVRERPRERACLA